MKYILVIDHIATGGAERILIDYYRHLKANGHETVIFVLSGHRGQSEWTDELNIIYGSADDNNNLIMKTAQQIRLLYKLNRLVSTTKPDVVFSFLEKSNLLTSLVKTNAVKVMTVHNVLSIQYTKVKSACVRKSVYWMIRCMYNRCHNVIAVSKQVKDDLTTSFGIKADNIHVVNNYVDREDILLKAAMKVDDFIFDDNVKYVMNIGRFSDQKAQWKLLKAFSVYIKGNCSMNVRLILMGRGEHGEKLAELTASLGIADRVIILPFNANPYKYMTHAHLFVLSSIFEGFPIVLAEVSSLRIPFVGSRKSVPEEMFSNRDVWDKCVYETVAPERDFSIEIHEDEKVLAELIKNGVENDMFRKSILYFTEYWEIHNQKKFQFERYDFFSKK